MLMDCALKMMGPLQPSLCLIPALLWGLSIKSCPVSGLQAQTPRSRGPSIAPVSPGPTQPSKGTRSG